MKSYTIKNECLSPQCSFSFCYHIQLPQVRISLVINLGSHLRSRQGEAWPDSRMQRVPASRCFPIIGHVRATCFISTTSSSAVTSFKAGLLLAHSTTCTGRKMERKRIIIDLLSSKETGI